LRILRARLSQEEKLDSRIIGNVVDPGGQSGSTETEMTSL